MTRSCQSRIMSGKSRRHIVVQQPAQMIEQRSKPIEACIRISVRVVRASLSATTVKRAVKRVNLVKVAFLGCGYPTGAVRITRSRSISPEGPKPVVATGIDGRGPDVR